MPRSGDVYSKPAGTTAVSGTVVESGGYNTLMDDIAADLNAARPVSCGGTGAASASAARTNLDVYSKAEAMPKSGGTFTGGIKVQSNVPTSTLYEADTDTAGRVIVSGGELSIQAGNAGDGETDSSGVVKVAGWGGYDVTSFQVRIGGSWRDVCTSDGFSVKESGGISVEGGENALYWPDASSVYVGHTGYTTQRLRGDWDVPSANFTLNGDQVVGESRAVSTGDGLSGGGNLSANRTLSVDSSVVRTSRTISSGGGLTGGGSLASNRTISHADTSSVTDFTGSNGQCISGLEFDEYGHVTQRNVVNFDNRYINQTIGVYDIGSTVMARWSGSGSVGAGGSVSGSTLQPSNNGNTVGSVIGSGTWRCCGTASDTSNATRTTLWRRVA